MRPSTARSGPPHHVHHHQGAQQAGRAAPHRCAEVGGGQGWIGVRAPGPPQDLAQRRLTRPPCTRRAHTAASGEQAGRAPEMPAARAAHSAVPADAATRTLALVEVRRARPRLEPGPPIPRRPPRGPESDLGERLAETGPRARDGRARRGGARLPHPPCPARAGGSGSHTALLPPLAPSWIGGARPEVLDTPITSPVGTPKESRLAPRSEGLQASESKVQATLGFRG